MVCVCVCVCVCAGFGGDCAVNFVNGVEQAQVFQGVVFVEFSRIGQVTSTDCRLDDGPFARCERDLAMESQIIALSL